MTANKKLDYTLRPTALITLGLLAVALPAMASDKPTGDIVDTAVAAGSFQTLVTAVKTAGLVATLKGDGPFTVFAPTDEAFGKLPAGTVENLLKPENRDQLTAILTYHVISGKVMASQVKNGGTATTLQGNDLGFAVAHGQVRVDEATVTTADIETSNGVIHVIDTVLLPQ